MTEKTVTRLVYVLMALMVVWMFAQPYMQMKTHNRLNPETPITYLDSMFTRVRIMGGK